MKPFALIAAYAFLVAVSSSTWAVDITIDSSQKFQTITGFGAMLYPYGAPTTEDSDFRRAFMTDLGCSMARTEVQPEVLDTEPQNLDDFLSSPIDDVVNQLKFDTDPERKLASIKSMDDIKIDDFKVIATVWSPPGWMKTNGSPKGGGSLRADRRAHFAKYLAAYCKGFEQKFGVPLYAISIQNELLFKEDYNSCMYDPNSKDYHDTIQAVGDAFKQYNIETKIMGPENVAFDGRGGFFYGSTMKFIDQVLSDPNVAPYLSIFCFHGYQADGGSVGGSKNSWSDYHSDLQKDNRELWMTETSGESADWLKTDDKGVQKGAIRVAIGLNDALVCGNVSAWVYWGILGKGAGDDFNLGGSHDPKSKKFAAARHFFRYIRPGAVRIAASNDPSSKVLASAFLHEKNGTLTIVLINTGTDPATTNVTLPTDFASANFKEFTTNETDTFASQPDVSVSGGKMAITLPPNTVATFYSGN